MREKKNSDANKPKNFKSTLYLNFVFYERKNDSLPMTIHNKKKKNGKPVCSNYTQVCLCIII